MKKRSPLIRVPVIAILMLITTGTFSQTSETTDTESDSSTTIHPIQVSFLPFICFNGSPLENTVYVSLNILGGYVHEVRAMEAGSIINIVGNNAGNCQLAGVANVVGGTSVGLQSAGVLNYASVQHGVQTGGVLNVVSGDAGICQLAGVANVTGGTSTGLQAAGVINYATTQTGAQAGGVFNIVGGDAGKCQVAGVGNITGGSVTGIQTAGVLNVVKSIKGAQLAGVGNLTAGSDTGLQVAGVLNYATRITGTQIAGVLNVAKSVKGTQLSVINISDSCQGVPIGVLNIVATGYHQVELSADELFYANIALRTGTRRFYNILMAGIRPGNFAEPRWTFGYGAGSLLGNPERLSYNIDLTAQQVNNGHFSDYVSLLCKLYVGVDKNIASNISLTAGVTFNYFIIDTSGRYYDGSVADLPLYTLTDITYRNGINIKTWFGGKIGFRFL